MTYGRCSYPTPSLEPQIATLEKLLDKGKITPEQFRRKKDRIVYLRNMFIARTNGAYTMPATPRGRGKKSIDVPNTQPMSIEEMREQATQSRLEEIRQRLASKEDNQDALGIVQESTTPETPSVT